MYKIEATAAAGDIIDQIRWMDKVCFRETNSLSFDSAVWWIAYDLDEVPVGYCGLTYFPTGFAFLSRAGVLPGSRGNGLQRRFVKVRERAARKAGVSRAVTYTSIANTHSSNNLIKCGYTTYQPDYYWGSKDAIYWERDL